LVAFGYEEVGLKIAYVTAFQNQNDPMIVRSYRPPLVTHGGDLAASLTLSNSRRAKATGIILERLAELFVRTVGLRVGFVNLTVEVDEFARRTWSFALPSYIRDWVRGHFVFY